MGKHALQDDAGDGEVSSRKKAKKDKPHKRSKHATTEAEPYKSKYREQPALSGLLQVEIDDFLSKHTIEITDTTTDTPLRPITSFSYLPRLTESQSELLKSYTAPTPIQAATWPFLFAGRDVVGIAETGSGKTLAFGVPCLRRMKKSKAKGLRAVMVAPTRELAIQVYKQIAALGGDQGPQAVCVYGGVPKEEQRKEVKTASIVVATPGRLKDLLNEGAMDLVNVEYLVLDEADRMLDKGFEQDIKEIVSQMPASATRQTAMFTATWPKEVRELAATFMKTPVNITIGGSASADPRANPRIKQIVEVVDYNSKEPRLLQLLNEHQKGSKRSDRILVFCLYKKEAMRIESFIRSRGFKVAGIHGDMGQREREKSLEAFKSGTVALLVATDVAARGLDIPAVKVVLNVTFPLTVEDYVHRIGRTGRAGASGLAITLFTENEKALSGP